MANILLVTPPFTQLNTPYPATAYLKGFFNTLNVSSAQADIGIEVINKLFSKNVLLQMFNEVASLDELSENAKRIYQLKQEYIDCVDRVVAFLQHPSMIEAHCICDGMLLPEASRFNSLSEGEDAFGTMGLMDKAKHYCTLFLEDLSDFIIEAVDEDFGFSRYAERLGRSASSFDGIDSKLKQPLSFIEKLLVDELSALMKIHQSKLLCLSIPFPGNLLGALRIGQWIKCHYPSVFVSMGGGFVNTELRSLKDVRLFNYCDFLTLDDGERPLQCLWEFINGSRPLDRLKRTLLKKDNAVEYIDNAQEEDVRQDDLGVPDYSDVNWDKYLSVLEMANPMFRLWSDGRWVKLTLAHGCYWGKCTFCDGSLDYIQRYEPAKISKVVDRIESIIDQTGLHGFHFVDEAAPPALLKALAIEIIRRRLSIVWWTNIRFEKSFTPDLCHLLKLSGCIAIAGGLEVASPRVLKLINKGVDIEQVSNTAANLSSAGIMVHAYLMYGFPSQTMQETVDSLEVVRQLFELGIVNSGFWHQFALTAHSPVGLNPKDYGVSITGGLDGDFANNDLEFTDSETTKQYKFSDGLKKAVYNYMHGLGFEYPLSFWFDFKLPATTIDKHHIEDLLSESTVLKGNSSLLFMAKLPTLIKYEKRKGKKLVCMLELQFNSVKSQVIIRVKPALGRWLDTILKKMTIENEHFLTLDEFQDEYEKQQLGDFSKFINSYTFSQLKEAGLLVL
ncbi:radical SAM protein [Carboxylicivirga sp. M1479]|uniref:B12-binding domain-containing radical SAM protein n=1 Tax=Carboxylicivirga sp. M1479 TaxID=2594476 RepID=UPI00117814BB|nr:radical SAM protein [Carboxylicivirga sp. M1479]TRX66035.1 radical SAM protein [Carboxylicivirga sp. M1479]